MKINEPKLTKVKSRKVNAYTKAFARWHVLHRCMVEEQNNALRVYATLNGAQIAEAKHVLTEGGFTL